MAPSAAASGVSATTSATGWPAHRISSRASGWWSRSVPSSTIGRSAAVSTATTPGTASASDVSIDTIRAWAGRASDRPAMEEAAHVDIGCELGGAGHLGASVDAWHGSADGAAQGVHGHLPPAIRMRGSIQGYRNSTTEIVKARPTMRTKVTLRIITRSSPRMARYRM